MTTTSTKSDSTPLDVSLALRDQRALDRALRAPSQLRHCLKNSLTPQFPAVPFPIGRHDDELNNDESSEDEDWSWSDAPRNQPQPGLSTSVMQVLQPSPNLAKLSCAPPPLLSSATSAETRVQCRRQAAAARRRSPSLQRHHLSRQHLGLDLSVEHLVRYQSKPKSMLTFTCGALLRRDEFANHYASVHADIQSQLDALEQRCPLATLGCTWTCRRLRPRINGRLARVVHDELSESFAFKPYYDTCATESSVGTSIEALPLDVLVDVLARVDGASLANLAMTSRKMRAACTLVLDDQGLIEQQWSRASRSHWRVVNRRWMFSCAFGKADSWTLGDYEGAQVQEHLRKCTIYERAECRPPVRLPGLADAAEAAAKRLPDATTESLLDVSILQRFFVAA